MYVFDFATKTWSEIQASGLLPSVRSCPAWAKDETHVVRYRRGWNCLTGANESDDASLIEKRRIQFIIFVTLILFSIYKEVSSLNRQTVVSRLMNSLHNLTNKFTLMV